MHTFYFAIFGNIFVSFLVAFSVNKWKEQKHFKVEKLNEYQVSQLLEETGLGDYLKTTECIVPSSSGKWKNGKIILFLVYNMLIMYNPPTSSYTPHAIQHSFFSASLVSLPTLDVFYNIYTLRLGTPSRSWIQWLSRI